MQKNKLITIYLNKEDIPEDKIPSSIKWKKLDEYKGIYKRVYERER